MRKAFEMITAVVVDLPVPHGRRETARRIASLDGLRAVSIALVLLGHLVGTRGFAPLDLGVGDYAHLGVVVFFVISGYLITGLLVAETVQQGRVSLVLFYARRALRLFPACYAYIVCVTILWLTGVVQVRSQDVLHAATYTVNYLPKPSWSLGHLWSLSVEEQFYLLWPCAFVALQRRRAILVAGAVILLGPVARIGAWLLGDPYRDLELFPLVADSLGVGCLLALTSSWLESQKWYLQLFRPGYSLGLLVLILLTNRYRSYSPVWVLGTSVINVGLAVLVHRSVYCSFDWMGRLLNLKPIAFVGVLSYSLYLWQQLFLDRTSSAWATAFPQNLAFAVAAALGSYLLLEKPMVALRHRLRRGVPQHTW
jgi:peptidoglycan/LPS O-acetylase OafA/YrhL